MDTEIKCIAVIRILQEFRISGLKMFPDKADIHKLTNRY